MFETEHVFKKLGIDYIDNNLYNICTYIYHKPCNAILSVTSFREINGEEGNYDLV